MPQAVLTYDRAVSRNLAVATGPGRYAIEGAFSEPVDLAERLFFLGAHIQETPATSLLVTFRRTATEGMPVDPAQASGPDCTGSGLIVEQRLHL